MMLDYENGELIEITTVRDIVTCRHCNRKYLLCRTRQITKYAEKSENICPYCLQSNGDSTVVSFCNQKLEV